MGNFATYCGISNIAITSEECYLLPLKSLDSYEGVLWYPATLPILGTYNGYGGLENIKKGISTNIIEETLTNSTIESFCENLTSFDEVSFYNFMWINKDVYDFMKEGSILDYVSLDGNFNINNLFFGDTSFIETLKLLDSVNTNCCFATLMDKYYKYIEDKFYYEPTQLDEKIAKYVYENNKEFYKLARELRNVQLSMRCFSKRFEPCEPYATPQDGDPESHKLILEKFIEILDKNIKSFTED